MKPRPEDAPSPARPAGAPPLIVTAALDPAGFAWFDDLRRAHFPPERNLVPAHLTLFHKLPGEEEAAVAEVLQAVCAATPPAPLAVRGPWSIGRGVAYRIASPELDHVRRLLAERFDPWLTPQDRASWRAHITIQNKADPDAAKRLLAELQHDFEPFDVIAEGLHVWRYLGGLWGAVATVGFTGRA